jgi:hypothetical protein
MARCLTYSRTTTHGYSDQYAFDTIVSASILDRGFALLLIESLRMRVK